MMRWLPFALGWRDLRHEPAAFVFQVLALAAVLAPLLILYGLKQGVVDIMTRDLAADPQVRQLHLPAGAPLPARWVEALARDPQVGFIAPHVRALSAQMQFGRVEDGQVPDQVPGVVLATGPGDPLLGTTPPPADAHTLVLSASLAQALGAQTGDTVMLIVQRRRQAQLERAGVTLRVGGILGVAAWSTAGALLDVSVLLAAERWQDGYAVPLFGAEGDPLPEGEPQFASVRLYARDLDAVRPLVERLHADGLRVRAELARIETLQAFDRSLGQMFSVIAGVASLGGLLAFAASLWSGVLRKQAQISQLRLQGLSRRDAGLMPLLQALAIALAGWGVAVGVYFAARLLIEQALGSGLRLNGPLCVLSAGDLGYACLMTLVAAALAASVAVRQVLRLSPADGFRQGGLA